MENLFGFLLTVSCLSWCLLDSTFAASCDGITPCVPMPTANEQFKKCCNSKNLGDCVKHCRYDADIKELKQAIMKDGDCELSDIRKFLRCAANNKDNSPCCEKTGVLDGNRAVCEPFCNPNSEDYPTSTKGAGKYLKCLKQFDQIMTCHHASCRN